jgi:hypothetical protein
MLRPGDHLLRRGAVDVVVAPAVHPTGTDWAAAVELRERVRAVILTACGEPDRA